MKSENTWNFRGELGGIQIGLKVETEAKERRVRLERARCLSWTKRRMGGARARARPV